MYRLHVTSNRFEKEFFYPNLKLYIFNSKSNRNKNFGRDAENKAKISTTMYMWNCCAVLKSDRTTKWISLARVNHNQHISIIRKATLLFSFRPHVMSACLPDLQVNRPWNHENVTSRSSARKTEQEQAARPRERFEA